MKHAVKITMLLGLLSLAAPIAIGASELQLEDQSLVEAVRQGDVDTVKELLNTLGSNTQPGKIRQFTDDERSFTLLHIAVEKDNEEMATFLLGLDGVDPNETDTTTGQSALHCVRSANMVKLLIEHGAKVNQESERGNTPLHDIALSGYSEAAMALLDRGADASLEGDLELTPHECALYGNCFHTLAMLLIHSRVIGNNNLFRPLHKAVIQGEGDETFDQLLRDGANINEQDRTSMTPLHWALLKGRISRTEYLLRHGADPNIKDKFERTPLYYAVELNDSALLALLLRYHADKRVRSEHIDPEISPPPLHQAAQAGNTRSLRLLLDQGEHPDSDRYRGETLLHFAASKGRESTVQFLLNAGANPNILNDHGHTSLDQAAIWGHASVARLLLAHGADANSQDLRGGTALHQAALKTHTDIVQLLLIAGANANTQDKNGNTVLHGAPFEITQQLLKSANQSLDIDLELENNNTLTPLSFAMQSYKDMEKNTEERCDDFAIFECNLLPDSQQDNLATTAHHLVAKGADISRLIPLLDSDNYPQASRLYHQLRTGPYTRRLQALQEYFRGLQKNHCVPRDVSRIIAGMLRPPKEVTRIFPTR